MAKKVFYKEEDLVFQEHPSSKQFIDLTNRKYGRLTFLGYAGKLSNGYKQWYCKCDCGKIVKAYDTNVKKRITNSCGCYQAEKASEFSIKHGRRHSSMYTIWCLMKQRCYNPNTNRFKHYGGRGITVCDRWKESFENFLADMGERPGKEYSLERNDVGGNYCPENCRWATMREQCNNKRNNVLITFNGKTQTVTQWGRELGMEKGVLYSRIFKYNFSIEEAITRPVAINNRRKNVTPETKEKLKKLPL